MHESCHPCEAATNRRNSSGVCLLMFMPGDQATDLLGRFAVTESVTGKSKALHVPCCQPGYV